MKRNDNGLSLMADAGYAAAVKRLNELETQFQAAKARVDEIDRSEAQRREREADVARVLADPVADESPANPRERASAIHKFRVLLLACEAQKREVAQQRNRALQTICQRVLPEYRKIIGEIVEAVTRVAQAVKLEREFRARLNDAEISYSATIRPMPWPEMDLENPLSKVSLYVKEARDYRLIEK